MRTIHAAQQWALEHGAELDAGREACEDDGVQLLNRIVPEKSKLLWDSGCWLQDQLQTLGAPPETIKSIQFAAGQRAFGGDAWQAVVDYVNEYAATGDTAEKGGAELAMKINKEIFG